MSNEMLNRAQKAYGVRLLAASTATALAAGSGRLLMSDTTHWLIALLVLCVAASAAMMLTLDLLQRRQHIKSLALLGEEPPPYGFSGPEPEDSAVASLKRTRAKTKTVH